MKCEYCDTELKPGAPIHHNSSGFRYGHHRRGAYACTKCATDKENNKISYIVWAEPFPCGNCGYPVAIGKSEMQWRERCLGTKAAFLVRPRHIACSEQCRRELHNAGRTPPRKRVNCETCKLPFHPKRADARYCSNRCRQKAHRDRSSPSTHPPTP